MNVRDGVLATLGIINLLRETKKHKTGKIAE